MVLAYRRAPQHVDTDSLIEYVEIPQFDAECALDYYRFSVAS